MSTEETALLFGLRPQTVRTRLHRARRLLRRALQDKLAAVFIDIFPFAGARCDRLTQQVLDRLGLRLFKNALPLAESGRARRANPLTAFSNWSNALRARSANTGTFWRLGPSNVHGPNVGTSPLRSKAAVAGA